MYLDYIYLVPAYLIGSLLTGYYLVKTLLNVDVRDTGSKSAGVTNVARLLGLKGIIITFVGDFSKGALVVYVASLLNIQTHIIVLSIFAVVAGHVYPAHLDFRGGKGVATFTGALLVYDYNIMLIITGIVLLLIGISRKRTASGLVGVLIIPVVAYFLQHTVLDILFLSLITAFVVYAHRINIQEFIDGMKEKKLEEKSK